jgi:hypothetical protein
VAGGVGSQVSSDFRPVLEELPVVFFGDDDVLRLTDAAVDLQ